ncbi:ABC transporter ATP-binding protein [Pseudomonas sp. S 311-6]|jgi:branched-chain amino acid transport system ATP-binding protein|uniref:ABC transporter n=1 Tax=Kerstersia gyiorum TaxID=206506 RepID=A0A171KVL4_9BURK|nr:ABC transporter ATP-binding protein [Kerstersia gyiorum]AZV94577.1 ABC transporter ATP-binding protein [Bordetella sp. J329]MCO7638416.1 ABC transporter ATP-binding protein [Pseudomonas sp. S 311-6]KKO72931.1 ABC transporter [Kerstersia gyiorum]MCH4273060.1 ABC transporter ATP-binding protein [Kerstersia gyiorum]MCI1230223.1 ABC transporter ATP-binding protein [Kerstersia gyiorum]
MPEQQLLARGTLPSAAVPLLQVSGLRQVFGGVTALDDVSFDLHAGEILALIGPNGAGKSTCFNILGGQARPTAGSVRFDGKELTRLGPQAIWRLGIGRTFQTAATFATLSVLENVQAALLSRDRRLMHVWRRAASYAPHEALALLEQVGLRQQAARPAGVLAYGDVKRLELAMALAHAPRLLLMDEPAAGMNSAERHALMELVRSLVEQRRLAVLFTEHSLDVVFRHASRVAVLAQGRLIALGSPAIVAEDPQVRRAYLGNDSFQR